MPDPGDLAELNRRLAVGIKILLPRCQRVKRVSRLVQDRLDVPLLAHGIHENEGQSRLGQRTLIPARRLPLAIVQIEEPQLVHLPELPRQLRIQLLENLLGRRHQPVDFVEGTQRRSLRGSTAKSHGRSAGSRNCSRRSACNSFSTGTTSDAMASWNASQSLGV